MQAVAPAGANPLANRYHHQLTLVARGYRQFHHQLTLV